MSILDTSAELPRGDAVNMFKPVAATSADEYIDMLTPERREIVLRLDRLVKEAAPELEPHFARNMLGYGTFLHRNHTKQEVEWPVIALASQKRYVSLYVCALDGGEYLAEKFGPRLGNVSVGKSCVRFRKIEDLDLEVVAELIVAAARNPGLA
jgi:Domain of unknown function (DU1801)